MDRAQWLRERRLWNEVQMDTIYAHKYDEHWGSSINPAHQYMVLRLLSFCPAGGRILDAACGTGKYWELLLTGGFQVTGTDQSQRMLLQATAKYPQVAVRHVGLQELDYVDTFDGIICVDAMENIFPEDWPVILGNFARALHERGSLYLTVETTDEEDLETAYHAGQRLDLPLVYGEYAHHGGYHHYPKEEQVQAWFANAGFKVLETREDDGYKHYLAKK
jgi:SAM-dependent methyltransferase